MAEQEKPKPEDIRPAGLADRLVPDPTNPDVRRLTGFLLGKSDRDAVWRLYLNRDLTYFLEFAKADTVHAEQVSPSETVIWVRPQTRVQVTRTGSVPVEFLRGDIIRQQMGQFTDASAMRRMMGVAAQASGCGHCTAACSNEATCPQHPGTGPGGNTVAFTCGC